jgi:multicomponent Na+:H+ antiporter subunit D
MLAAGRYSVAAVALAVSLLTVLSMARLWEDAFWKPSAGAAVATAAPARLGGAIVAPIAFLVSLTIAMTALAGPISSLTVRAATHLLDGHAYQRAVLGEEAPRAAR